MGCLESVFAFALLLPPMANVRLENRNAFGIPRIFKHRARFADEVYDSHPRRRSSVVIQLTRLNNTRLALNCDLIKYVEEAPDTVITLLNGEKLVVRETTAEVIDRVCEFRRSVLRGAVGVPSLATELPPEPHQVAAYSAASSKGPVSG